MSVAIEYDQRRSIALGDRSGQIEVYDANVDSLSGLNSNQPVTGGVRRIGLGIAGGLDFA